MASTDEMTQLRPLMTIREVCELLSVSRSTCLRMIERGDLKTVPVHNTSRVDPESVLRVYRGEAE